MILTELKLFEKLNRYDPILLAFEIDLYAYFKEEAKWVQAYDH